MIVSSPSSSSSSSTSSTKFLFLLSSIESFFFFLVSIMGNKTESAMAYSAASSSSSVQQQHRQHRRPLLVRLHSLHSPVVVEQIAKKLNLNLNLKQDDDQKNDRGGDGDGDDDHRSKDLLRVVHLVRHAEGYHNVNRDYRNPLNIDAQLTPYGIKQCQDLSERLQLKKQQEKNHKREEKQQQEKQFHHHHEFLLDPNNVECIITSPMRRAIQTAYHSFGHILMTSSSSSSPSPPNASPKSSESSSPSTIPFVACENWRETMNYVCDVRLPLTRLRTDFPFVDFSNVEHEDDPISKYYEDRHGSFEEHQDHRESDDDEALRERIENAWRTIAKRPETSIAVVSHSAFFMHMFTRCEELGGIVSYEDDDVRNLMTLERGFDNCEMRSVAVEIVQ